MPAAATLAIDMSATHRPWPQPPWHPPLHSTLWLTALCLALAGCATRPSAPRAGSPWQTDGPEANPPPGLSRLPDAQPVAEPIRAGGPNKPYEQFGVAYTPLPPDAALSERGLASWYGRKFHGRRTANGEVYDMYAMTAAHRTLPLPSYARVSNPANGRSIIVRVNDRGPFVKGRVIDLSYSAALNLCVLGGVSAVHVERITPEQIRSGAWRPAAPVIEGDEPPAVVAMPASPSPATPVAPAAPVLTAAAPERANPSATVASPGFWVQLGAYRERQGAEHLQRQAAAGLDSLAAQLAVFNESALYRVQAGPFATRDEAQRAADLVLDRLLLVAVVVERR